MYRCMHAKMLTWASATTFATVPKVQQDFGGFTMTPGSATDIAQIGCPAGERIGIWMYALRGTYFDYFQDYNPCRECFCVLVAPGVADKQIAIGLYIIVE